MSEQRGGFFGKIFGGLSKVFGPIVSGIGSAVSGIFGGAKKKATQVAHQAISHAKKAAVTAIQTGDIRGAAKGAMSNIAGDVKGAYRSTKGEATAAYSKTKGELAKAKASLAKHRKEAMAHATSEFERGKAMAKAEASKRINAAHDRFQQVARQKYESVRSHPQWQRYGFESRGRSQSAPRRRRSPSPRRRSASRARNPPQRRQVPSYDDFYGAGFVPPSVLPPPVASAPFGGIRPAPHEPQKSPIKYWGGLGGKYGKVVL